MQARAARAVAARVLALQQVLLDRADEAGDAYLPGYTHLQRAQPVLLAHHLLAHGWALARDVDRLVGDASRALDVSPLGAGALAGSSLPLDPDGTAADLGFAARVRELASTRSATATSSPRRCSTSRCSACTCRASARRSCCGRPRSSASPRLADAYATGSSMLPQKKNPDIAELARGKAGRLIGHLTGLLATLKGLPLAYNRDLQEDKEPLFDAVDQVALALAALTGMIATATFDLDAHGRGRRRSDARGHRPRRAPGRATGMPFREAHAVVGALVRKSLDAGAPLADLVGADTGLGAEAAALLEPGAAVRRRVTAGGGGPDAVAVQVGRFRERLAADRARV